MTKVITTILKRTLKTQKVVEEGYSQNQTELWKIAHHLNFLQNHFRKTSAHLVLSIRWNSWAKGPGASIGEIKLENQITSFCLVIFKLYLWALPSIIYVDLTFMYFFNTWQLFRRIPPLKWHATLVFLKLLITIVTDIITSLVNVGTTI